MKSMTGFGKGEAHQEDSTCIVEVKTVNNRYKDIHLKVPSLFNVFDQDIRQILNDNFARGRIDVTVVFNSTDNSAKVIKLNKGLARHYLEALNELMNLNSMIETKIPLSYLADLPEILTVEEEADEEFLLSLLKEALEIAVGQCNLSREREGRNLEQDINFHIEKLEELITQVEALMPKAVEEAKEKLHQRLENVLKDYEIDENRFLTEAAVLSDKLAIEEEVTRLKSHLERLKALTETSGAVGRQMDFLLQELNREVNTIGSKSQNLTISNLVVDLKSEIEKIREQVQNVE